MVEELLNLHYEPAIEATRVSDKYFFGSKDLGHTPL